MSISSVWQQVFPANNATQVVAFLQQTWRDLIAHQTPQLNGHSHEPHLTVFLCGVLKDRALGAGLTGRFSPESLDIDVSLETGKIANRRRTDIHYFSDKANLDLTFEFKKLKPTIRVTVNSQKAYCEEGILRFVEGKYSANQTTAFMVGMVESAHKTGCIHGVQLAITAPSARLMEPIAQPSVAFPNHADFDSKHARAINESPIVLSHLFLEY